MRCTYRGFQEGAHQALTPKPSRARLWARPCQLLPDLTFTSLFYLLREGTSGSEPGKQTGSCHCTCPRRRRRNTLLTKGRIFRAAFPPIKAACLIPSKLKIKGRLFPELPTHKAPGEEKDLFVFTGPGGPAITLPSHRRGCGQVEGLSRVWLVPFGSRTSSGKRELLEEELGRSHRCLTKDLLKPLSFPSSTWRTGSRHSFYFLITKA